MEDTPQQTELMPLAIVHGQPFTDLPQDLYIPPEALEIFLETFEGPLDLLLYLIKKENLDILDIPIARITAQYLEYIDLMKHIKLELAADYLVMAAMLAEIKSRILLPRPTLNPELEEEDPRAELVRRLQEYEQMKQAANDLISMPQQGHDIFLADIPFEKNIVRKHPDLELDELLVAFKSVLQRLSLRKHHEIRFETISVRQRMVEILDRLGHADNLSFVSCFNLDEGRSGVVATFIAMLELLKQQLIKIEQLEPFAAITIVRKTVEEIETDVATADEVETVPESEEVL